MTGFLWWLPIVMWFVGGLGICLVWMKVWIGLNRRTDDRD